MFAVVLCGSGAQCPQATWPTFPDLFQTPPRVLPDGPTVEQVVAAVNESTAAVRTLSTRNATITLPGMTVLRADIALEPPRRLRLRAGTALMGGELDLGSNDDLFWLWVRRGEPRHVYYCRHAEHAAGVAGGFLPVEASWLIEAPGLARLDPGLPHQGPYERPGGVLEIRSPYRGPAGELIRITRVDPKRAWVLEQHLVRGDGLHVAASRLSGHTVDSTSGSVLPRRVQLEVPPAGISIQIDLGEMLVNQPAGDPSQLWSKPVYEGYREVDLRGEFRWRRLRWRRCAGWRRRKHRGPLGGGRTGGGGLPIEACRDAARKRCVSAEATGGFP